MSLALDRHYDEVWKKRVRGYYGGFEKDERIIGILSHTRTTCSCPMCGNARKYFNELTIQEKKALLDFKDQLKEVME